MVRVQLEDVNATNISAVMSYTNTINPGFFPLVIFGAFIIATLGSYFSQKRLSGTGDFFGSAAVGAYLSTILALFLSFIPGAIDAYTLIVCLASSMGITILFFLSRDKF